MSSLLAVRKRLREIYGKSCENTITRADIREAGHLMEDAEKGVELALPYAKSLARELDLEMGDQAVQIGPQKTMARIFEKAVGKYNGNLEEIGDAGRLRCLLDGPEDVMHLRRMFAAGKGGRCIPYHPDNYVTVVGFQDFFWEPSKTGRIGYHVDLDVTISGGKSVGIEIQFIDKHMVGTEKATHLNYQKVTAIERKALREGRPLREEELQSIEEYRDSTQKMYLGDAINYGYYDLRRPDIRAKESFPHLRLVV